MNLVTGKANLFLSQSKSSCVLTDQVPGYKWRARNVDSEVAGAQCLDAWRDASDGLGFTWMICRADWLVSMAISSGSLSVLGAE